MAKKKKKYRLFMYNIPHILPSFEVTATKAIKIIIQEID
jgi:hypothetical protein